MRNLIYTGLCCQLLISLSNAFAEDPTDDPKSVVSRVISYESHPFKNDPHLHKLSHASLRYRVNSAQEDHSPSSMSDLTNTTGIGNALDQENIVFEFIKPLESEPKNPLGGSSMNAPTLFSLFSHAQLQSAAALKLLEKYKYNPLDKETYLVPLSHGYSVISLRLNN